MRILTLGYDMCRYLQAVVNLHNRQDFHMHYKTRNGIFILFGCSGCFVYCWPGLFDVGCIYAFISSVFSSKVVG